MVTVKTADMDAFFAFDAPLTGVFATQATPFGCWARLRKMTQHIKPDVSQNGTYGVGLGNAIFCVLS